MSLTSGSRLGPYEVVAPLGAGGMGEVYRARDSRLGRDVALKVLPPAFADDPDRRARFTREAQVLASLNHPNIAAIYGVEQGDREDALVLELVEGPTLADRIFASRLPIEETLAIAKQIAYALDAAHEQGIIHRDLKPSNVKVRPDGTVKVLDFGLAKLAEDAVQSRLGAYSQSPTVTSPAMTVAGVILGTASYMSPEQARGQAIDKRTDVWAFGCVIYEMLTGVRAFDGETTTDVLAAILEREPDWRLLPDTTPPTVTRLVRQCLERDRRKRRRDIGDAILELETTVVAKPEDVARAPARSRWPLAVATIAAVAAAAALIVVLYRRPVMPAESTSLPSLTRITSDGGFTADPAISRDGALVAYASDRGGGDQLDIWVQQTKGSTPIRITRDTFDEREPSFSPDGSRIVFRSERDGGGIYVVPTFGSDAPRFLASGGRRPRFSPDGQFVAYWTGGNIGFTARAGRYRTFIVPVAGGAPREVPQMTSARFPVWSSDGKALLVLGSQAAEPRAEALDWWVIPVNGGSPIATGALPRLLASGVNPEETEGLNSAATGMGPEDWNGSRVLFSNFRFLWSTTIDPQTFKATGAPQRLTLGTNHDAQPVTSASGAIAFSSASLVNTVYGLTLNSSTGAVSGSPVRLSEGISFDTRPSSSADGRLIAYRSSTPQSTVIVKNLAENRLIDLGIRPSDFGPGISPDGRWVAFETRNGVDIVPSQGGPSRTLCRDCTIGDWTEDGTGLAVVRADRLGVVDVMSASNVDLVVGKALNRPFVSPDKRLLAFRSQDNNTNRIYVSKLEGSAPAGQDRWIPLGPGELDVRPAGWSSDGALLYLVSSRDGVRCLYAVRIDRASGQPQGDAFIVRHFHGSRNAWASTVGVLSTGPASAVRGGRFVYDLATFSANVWLMSGAPPGANGR